MRIVVRGFVRRQPPSACGLGASAGHRRLHGHARSPERSRVARDRVRPRPLTGARRPRAGGDREGSDLAWAVARLAPLVARPDLDPADARRARARGRGPDEPPRHIRRRQLGVAARARQASPRPQSGSARRPSRADDSHRWRGAPWSPPVRCLTGRDRHLRARAAQTRQIVQPDARDLPGEHPMSGAGYVGILSVELHFSEAGSLKGKRKYVKSAKAQLQAALRCRGGRGRPPRSLAALRGSCSRAPPARWASCTSCSMPPTAGCTVRTGSSRGIERRVVSLED